MSTATTTEPDVLRSRLPGPSRYFPELGTIAGAMSKAIRNDAIPGRALRET